MGPSKISVESKNKAKQMVVKRVIRPNIKNIPNRASTAPAENANQ